ncbi:sugar transferase [Demequina maris]|uniref:sugar transferase n=1 Tax=Demequina maris TaxID=1638982 RepID=UPI0007823CD8|nr:sugar transferase [Demequina maris]
MVLSATAQVGQRSATWARSVQRRIAITDAFVVAMTMVIAHGLRFGWEPFIPLMGPAAPAYIWATVGISALWVLQLGWTRSRDIRILGSGPEEYQRVLSAGIRTFGLVAVVGFFGGWALSRGYLLFAFPVGTLVLFGYRRAWRAWLHQQRKIGRLRQPVVIVGPRRTVVQMVRRLSGDYDHAYQVAGVCLSTAGSGTGPAGGPASGPIPVVGAPLADDLPGVPVLGTAADAATAAQRVGAEYIVLAGNDDVSLAEARRLEWAVEDTGIGLIVAPTVADVAAPRVLVSQVAGLPLMHVEPPHFSGPSRVLKYAADKVGATVILFFLGIPMLLIAAAVKLSSKGPVLYKQQRVGLDHEPFQMLKFRSMYMDADARRAEALTQDDGNGVLAKRHDDPRITPVGRFIRRYSLDELPQLINVLKGDMSLVGPRPPLPSETELWDADVFRRQLVRPGITGLWQVSGRSDLSWEESVRLDLHYTHNWTLGLDAVILLRTVWAVIAGKGAY